MASGLGLVAVVGWSLYATARQDRDRAELDARRAAHDLALALRAALRDPTVLASAPAAARFALVDGSLQVDEAVGWLVAQPPNPPDAATAGQLQTAARAEFVDGDPARAAAVFESLLAPGPGGPADLGVLAAAAWQAQRQGDGDGERATALAKRLDGALAKLAPSALADRGTADAVASAALLAAARGATPDFTERLVPALPLDLALATLARLAERGVPTTALAERHAQVAARRLLLAAVATHQSEFVDAPFTRPAAGGLLVWFPAAARGHGQGALLDAAFVATFAAAPPTPLAGRGRLCFTAPPADAEEIAPQFAWVVPEPLPDPSWLTRPATVASATGALVLVFATTLWLGWRAQRREALATRARAEFVTGVTHELKTPVASIRLIADVLQTDDVPPARQREYQELLAGEAMRLSTLVDNVLDLGQRERGERACDRRPGDLADLVRTAVRLFAPIAREHGLALALAEPLPACPAAFDEEALLQAVRNVLENARKYAADGGRLDVSLRHCADRADRAELAIRDHGRGVPPGEREAIFARFTRGAHHRHGSVPGLGIGLFLARQIARAHDGDLVCDAPADGPGARFVFTFGLDPGTP